MFSDIHSSVYYWINIIEFFVKVLAWSSFNILLLTKIKWLGLFYNRKQHKHYLLMFARKNLRNNTKNNY